MNDSIFEHSLRDELRKRLRGEVEYGPHPVTGEPQLIEFGDVDIVKIGNKRFLTCLFRSRSRPTIQYGYRYDLESDRPPWPPGQLATFLALEVDEVIEAPNMGLPLVAGANSMVWIGE